MRWDGRESNTYTLRIGRDFGYLPSKDLALQRNQLSKKIWAYERTLPLDAPIGPIDDT